MAHTPYVPDAEPGVGTLHAWRNPSDLQLLHVTPAAAVAPIAQPARPDQTGLADDGEGAVAPEHRGRPAHTRSRDAGTVKPAAEPHPSHVNASPLQDAGNASAEPSPATVAETGGYASDGEGAVAPVHKGRPATRRSAAAGKIQAA